MRTVALDCRYHIHIDLYASIVDTLINVPVDPLRWLDWCHAIELVPYGSLGDHITAIVLDEKLPLFRGILRTVDGASAVGLGWFARLAEVLYKTPSGIELGLIIAKS